MNKEMRDALTECREDLKTANSSLDYADDQDDEFLVSVHWAIKDIIDDIEKALK